ncbi:MAG: GntR family transcriptional regulator [Rhodospirillales bacterium]|jgi:DNA-binding GntR family transcriptional regulator|nr:GntR family transcriptional regulator [Rhodospirillales bacterium]
MSGATVKIRELPPLNDAMPPLVVQPLEPSLSFRDRAYAALKQAIMDADIYGQKREIRLDERQLSAALGVSRTPVREAMTLLEQEGFLRSEPRRGVFIIRKTKREILEMIEVSAGLESMAARLAATRATPEEIANLRRMFDDFVNENPEEHIDEYSDANLEFHQAIVRMGRSELIARMIDNLFVHVRAIRRVTIGQAHRAERSIVDHMNIIEALAAGDADRAGQLVLDHALGLAAHVEEHCTFLE